MGTYLRLWDFLCSQLLFLPLLHHQIQLVFNQKVEHAHLGSAQRQRTGQKLPISHRNINDPINFPVDTVTFRKYIMLLIFLLGRVLTVYLQSLCHSLHISGCQVTFIPLFIYLRVDKEKKDIQVLNSQLWIKAAELFKFYRKRVNQTGLCVFNWGLDLGATALWAIFNHLSLVSFARTLQHNFVVFSLENRTNRSQ